MDAKVIRPKAQDIQDRFFQAVDMLIESGKVKSLQAFCKDYGLHRPKYSNLRTRSKDPEKVGTGYKFIDVDALAYLVRDFKVSSDWLLIGKGGMFRK
jgi:DNA polymerase/3'-5' exonuclease PolX